MHKVKWPLLSLCAPGFKILHCQSGKIMKFLAIYVHIPVMNLLYKYYFKDWTHTYGFVSYIFHFNQETMNFTLSRQLLEQQF